MSSPNVAELVSAVLHRSADFALWSAMLREDPVFGKIPEDLRRPAVEQAMEYGSQASADLLSRFGEADPAAISGRLGVRVAWSDDPHVFGKIVQTSTYVHRTRTITIYRGSVEEMNRFLAEQGLVQLLRVADVGPAYLAHELFHHLEDETLGRAADLLQVITFKLGPIVRRSGIAQMSEIAADAFAQRLLGLPFAPGCWTISRCGSTTRTPGAGAWLPWPRCDEAGRVSAGTRSAHAGQQIMNRPLILRGEREPHGLASPL